MKVYLNITLAIMISSFTIFSSTANVPLSARCGRPSLCNDFFEHSAIFVGRIISGSEKVGADRVAGDVRFTVEEVFKGDIGSEAQIFVSSMDDTGMRVYGLFPGQSYLVFARGIPKQLSTGMCSRTRPLALAKVELNFLRGLSAAGAGGRIFGWIEETQDGSNRVVPIPGLTVALENAEKQRLVGQTNAEGYLEFNGLMPGKYKVIPAWPNQYAGWLEEGSQEIEISELHCKSGGFRAIARRKKNDQSQ